MTKAEIIKQLRSFGFNDLHLYRALMQERNAPLKMNTNKLVWDSSRLGTYYSTPQKKAVLEAFKKQWKSMRFSKNFA